MNGAGGFLAAAILGISLCAQGALPALNVSVEQLIDEGAGQVTGTVAVSSVVASNLTIELVSDNTAEVTGGVVTIPSGTNSAAFSLSVVDDNLLDGIQTATITASADGYAGSSASVFIQDNELKALFLDLPDGVFEGHGTLTNAGMVYLDGVAATDLHILLQSTDTSEVTIPMTVTIPAGQSNAFFNVTVVDDSDTDGRQYPTVTAQFPGFTTGTNSIAIGDNEFSGFSVSVPGSDLPGNVPLLVSIEAANIDGELVESYSGAVSLSARLSNGSSVAVSPSSGISLVNGQWQGAVTVNRATVNNVRLEVSDNQGHTGASSYFDLFKLRLKLMVTDWQMPYIYMLHRDPDPDYPQWSDDPGAKLIWYNTDFDAVGRVVNPGDYASDLTVHYGENLIYVSRPDQAVIYDRSTMDVLVPMSMNSSVRLVSAGKPGRIYAKRGDEYYSTYFEIWDTESQELLKSIYHSKGGGTCSPDGRYYYTADSGSTGSKLTKYDVTEDTFNKLVSVDTHNFGSANIVLSGDGSRIFNIGAVWQAADLKEIAFHGYDKEVYASSFYGQYAVTEKDIINVESGESVMELLYTSKYSAFSKDQSKLLRFEPSTAGLQSIPLDTIGGGLPRPGVLPSLRDGEVVGINLPELMWSAGPVVLYYDLYLGTDSNVVANADRTSGVYLGRRTEPGYALEEGMLAGNTTYYWRVDTIGFGEALSAGDVWSFRTTSFVVDPPEVVIEGVEASYTQSVSVAIDSGTGGPINWTVSCRDDWVLLGNTNGATPASLDFRVDISSLAAGTHASELLFSDGDLTLAVPVSVSVERMEIVKMAADWTLPYIYMIHDPSGAPTKSRLIWYNTDTDTIEQVLNVGENATDLTVHYGEDRIYVSNLDREESRVFDRDSKQELEPLLLDNDVYRINAGRAGRLYTTRYSYPRYNSVYDTATGTRIASSDSIYQGDAECTLDGRYLYHCERYTTADKIIKYDVSGDTFSIEKLVYIDGSKVMLLSFDGSRVFSGKKVFDADLNELLDIGSEIYAASAYGDMVVTYSAAYDGVTGEEVYTLPFSSTVMAFSGDQSKLVLFNADDATLSAMDTVSIRLLPPADIMPTPGVGEVCPVSLSEISWTLAVSGAAYDVYIGTDSNAVVRADSDSAEYLGRYEMTKVPLFEDRLLGNQTYYWRVDAITHSGELKQGDLWSFKTASIVVDPSELEVEGLAATYTQTVHMAINSTVGTPVPWSVSCTNDWVVLGATNGIASDVLEFGLDLSGLTEGNHDADLVFKDVNGSFSVPVKLSVEKMHIVKMEADWGKPYVYMLHTDDSNGAAGRSKLIWYNTQNDSIELVLDAGTNGTDLAVHYQDDRIYVTNYRYEETRVFDRTSKRELDSLLLRNDVFHIVAGRAGHVYTENQYYSSSRLSAFSTSNSVELGSATAHAGDGACTLDGLSYYHCSDWSPNELIKYDVSGGGFSEVVRKSIGGAWNLLISVDGSRICAGGIIYDENLNEVLNLGIGMYEEFFAISAYGDLVVTETRIYDGVSGAEVYELPFYSRAMAFSGDQSKLVLFNTTEATLHSLETSGIMPLPAASLLETLSPEFAEWQEQHFPNAVMSEDADSDMDGVCNIDEYIAGTDPTSADSCFAMYDAVPLSDGRMVIYWDSVTGRVYSVYWAPSLAAPFQLLGTNICYPQNSYTDQVERVEQSGFYKVGVELK